MFQPSSHPEVAARPFARSSARTAPRLPAGVALIVLCLLGMVALPYWAGRESAELQSEIGDTLAPLEIALERLHREVTAMANEMRGYLLTGDESFIAEFKDEQANVRADLALVRELAARTEPAIVRQAAAAENAYMEWLAHSRTAMGLDESDLSLRGQRRRELSAATLRRLDGFSDHMGELSRLARARESRLRERVDGFQKVERSLVLVLGTLAGIVVVYLTYLATALLRAQRAAVEERDQLEAVLASVDSGIVLLDRSLRVLVANERARELLGVPLRQLVGADQRAIVREHLKPRMADAETFEKRLGYLYANPDAVAEDLVEVALPERRTLARYSSPVRDERGEVFGRIEVYRDVTDALRRERELAEANERKDRFVATLSHELRTPLTPILGWIELLKRERDPDRIARGLAAIQRNVQLEGQLVEDLLDLSRVVKQKLELDFAAVEVTSAVGAAVDTVRHLAESKSVVLEVALPSAPVTVVADETRLIQVIWNLVSNAIKFTPAGRRVRLAVGVAAERLEVVVEDEGEGIAPDFLRHVFTPFEQGHGLGHGSRVGLGIGLALSRSLVELHGGEIAAHSEGPGRGARFAFWIPVAPPGARGADVQRAVARQAAETRPVREIAAIGLAAAKDGPRSAQPFGTGSGLRRGAAEGLGPAVPGGAASEEAGLSPAGDGNAARRVLIVEDNPDTLEAMRVLLESWGYAVETSDNAGAALAALRREMPTAIISDIGMPQVDGLAFARQVRSCPPPPDGGRRALLIAITGYASHADRSRALEAGFDAYLTKPIDFESLRALLERLSPASEASRRA